MQKKYSKNDMIILLKELFNYNSFKFGQFNAIEGFLSGRDVFVSLATGYGKSICYQMIPLILRKLGRKCTILVISPLKALIEDQINNINKNIYLKNGIPFNKNNTNINNIDEINDVACKYMIENEDQIYENKYAIVYVTPEKLNLVFSKINHKIKNYNFDVIGLIIDEAHCISEWGHNFRPEFRLIKRIINFPIMALSASATIKVKDDIIKQLNMSQNRLYIKSSFNRKNIEYNVIKKTKISSQNGRKRSGLQEDIEIIKNILSISNNLPAIIYVQTKKTAENLAKKINNSAYYHAGISDNIRNEVHKKFMNNDINVIIATIAYGMGIDKTNIRTIIHYGLPKTIEGYYQETGRAGRDSLDSKCFLFWSFGDIYALGSLIKKEEKTTKMEKEIYKNILNYVNLKSCRREFILSYFGEIGNCKSSKNLLCDNCQPEIKIPKIEENLPIITPFTKQLPFKNPIINQIEVQKKEQKKEQNKEQNLEQEKQEEEKQEEKKQEEKKQEEDKQEEDKQEEGEQEEDKKPTKLKEQLEEEDIIVKYFVDCIIKTGNKYGITKVIDYIYKDCKEDKDFKITKKSLTEYFKELCEKCVLNDILIKQKCGYNYIIKVKQPCVNNIFDKKVIISYLNKLK